MMCDNCGQHPASFHITTVTGEERKERNLCPECMAKLKQQMPGIDLNHLTGLLSGFLQAIKANNEASNKDEPGLKCGQCGMTYSAFRKVGLLGCANCYQDFKEPLRELLGSIHGRTQHVGRVPKNVGEDLSIRFQVERLRTELKTAIAEEEYENAASLRDQIRALDAQLEENNVHIEAGRDE